MFGHVAINVSEDYIVTLKYFNSQYSFGLKTPYNVKLKLSRKRNECLQKIIGFDFVYHY